jgi:Tripartite tricarboxylate transporter family receptor
LSARRAKTFWHNSAEIPVAIDSRYREEATPPQIIDKLNKETNAGLANPKFKAQLASLGGTVLPGSAAYFGKLIADETEKWGNVIRAPAATRKRS